MQSLFHKSNFPKTDGFVLNLGIKRGVNRMRQIYTRSLQLLSNYITYLTERFLVKWYFKSLTVFSGPFEDLILPFYPGKDSYWRPITPKLLGVYEKELFPIYKKVIQKKYSTIIVIGCSEGYEAVGLALKCRAAKIFAFDINSKFLMYCKSLAIYNNVLNRMKIGKMVSDMNLNKIIDDNTFILCDCEGCENKIMNINKIPKLRKCDVLVEIHDYINDKPMDTLKIRFGQTHKLKTIRFKNNRNRNLFTNFKDFKHIPTNRNLEFMLDEHRYNKMVWYYFEHL